VQGAKPARAQQGFHGLRLVRHPCRHSWAIQPLRGMRLQESHSLYAIYIAFETPLSGMSMNPARTFGSAWRAGDWHAMWIYFIAPTLGMCRAAELFLRVRGGAAPYCAKLHHANNKRCIFHHA
jgi:major intrinsic protein